MKLKILSFTLAVALSSVACISTKSTIRNVDNTVPLPALTKDNTFFLNTQSKDKKYGYDKDYPINIFFRNAKNDTINQQRYLNALAGPEGQKITYKKLENCCPFPTKSTETGAGFLDVYEINWQGQAKPVKLYLNMYERGALMIPVGFTAKKIN